MTAWRTLSDPELYDLDQEIERRQKALGERGVQIFGVPEHYLRTLLEELLSERQLAAAREKHLLWVQERLDEIEPQVQTALAMQKLGIGPQVDSAR